MAFMAWSHDKANMAGFYFSKNYFGGKSKVVSPESSPLGLSKDGECWAGKRSRHKDGDVAA